MSADFVLFLRSAMTNDPYSSWHPETLMYSYDVHGPFEIFARAESAKYFNRILPMLHVQSRDNLRKLIESFSLDGSKGRWLPRWQYRPLAIAKLSNLEKLATRA
jgi:hypothetical protein